MTIRRQYSLPNCTLILEGLSDNPTTGSAQLDARPLMTILVSAECYFSGREQPLRGGRDFFESLVRSVSRYAQEFLSQIHHPKLPGDKPEIVQLQKIPGKSLHRLTLPVTAEAVPVAAGIGMTSTPSYMGIPQGVPMQLDLTTVQLFDLVEAIDQFLADRRTLPDLKISLEPISRRYRKADEPIAKRAAPAAIGVTGLALSAAALMLIPIPRESKPSTPQPNAKKTTAPTPKDSPSPIATPKPSPPSTSELENLLSSNPEIIDPTHLRFLQRRLYRSIDSNWKNRRELQQNLEYQVSVGKDGSIIGYKPVKSTPTDAAKQTPLLDLLYTPTTGSIPKNEPLAQFRVVFDRKGILQISPWRGYQGKPSLGPKISDSELISRLEKQLEEQLRDNWSTNPTFPKNLVYRVAVTQEGVIADYEEKNQPASDYVDQTPLDKLIKPEAGGMGNEAVPQKPLAQFRVVFKPDKILEVSPYPD
ncbi:MAG: hypothetical protein Fur006_21270 [Coleofasciculaceae cyanobacterium]